MVRRFIRWWNVLVVAWAMRDMPEQQLRDLLARCFPHRDGQWRDELYEAARQRNRARRMREAGV